MAEDFFDSLKQSVLDGAPERAVELARRALEHGMEPLEAINRGFVPGMDRIGEQFARREVFLPDLVAAGEAMKAAMKVLEPEMRRRGVERQLRGRVVLGTVHGDIHEIGKNLVGILLAANGFEVFDLGVNVTPEAFIRKALEVKADVVGASALLTTTMAGQKQLVEQVERAGLRPRVKVIVGGAPVTRQWAEGIGSDGYGKDAISSVALVKALLDSAST
ncbi:MAG TPA: corrinoid protein [Terriglobales bacterium]|nr:corrinoid protein [Terriglobales bacterium]